MTRAYGWIPDLPDRRDRLATVEAPSTLPASISLRAGMPPVYDQGQLGSCTANAISAAFDFDRKVRGEEFMTPSRLGFYWSERDWEGTVDSDAGARIRDGIKVTKAVGMAPESLWPYNVKKFAVRPPRKYFTVAQANESLTYAKVPQTATAIKSALARKLPVVIGFTVYESFESPEVATTGVVPMPGHGEQVLGGHAVLLTGYDTKDGKPMWEVRNSWGPAWGDEGYFWFPADYLTNPSLSSDFWQIQSVE